MYPCDFVCFFFFLLSPLNALCNLKCDLALSITGFMFDGVDGVEPGCPPSSPLVAHDAFFEMLWHWCIRTKRCKGLCKCNKLVDNNLVHLLSLRWRTGTIFRKETVEPVVVVEPLLVKFSFISNLFVERLLLNEMCFAM